MYSRGLRNKNEEHLVNLYESSNLEKHKPNSVKSELARTLFPVESTNR